MAPKFPNPDPPTDSVRDRLDQFIQVAGRAVYPPLAVAPSPTTAGQIWWDISDTIKIRNEANAAWASLATTMGAVSFKEAQTLTSGEKTQALANIGGQPVGSYQPAGGYVRYDAAQSLNDAQKSQARTNTDSNALDTGLGWDWVPRASPAFGTNYTNTTGYPMYIRVAANCAAGGRAFVRVSTVAVSQMVKPETGTYVVTNAYIPAGSVYQVAIDAGSVTALDIVEYKKV